MTAVTLGNVDREIAGLTISDVPTQAEASTLVSVGERLMRVVSLDCLLTKLAALGHSKPNARDNVTTQEIQAIVEETLASFRNDECRTCDCFQGFLVQLEIDFTAEASTVVVPHKVPRSAMHGCMGCDPCPPGAAFSGYLRKRQQPL